MTLRRMLIALLPIVALTACDQGSDAPDRPTEELTAILADNAGPNIYDRHIQEAPDDGERIKINSVGPLKKVFNDSNHVHLEAARAIGIKPIKEDRDILRLDRALVEVKSTPQYFVDELRHSYPYLVPEAARLLHDIGQAFNDSLKARGGGAYRLKVTSVLRTPATVKRLRRVNGNATEESTHNYGTTFDISYSKFICDDSTAPHRHFEDLKNLLAEVLKDMRDRGRCYVKYEYKQSCFHITTRPQNR